MRSQSTGVFLLLTVLLLAAPHAEAQSTRTVSRTVALASDGEVHVEAFTGRVEVRGWERDSVAIEAQIEGEDPDAVEQTRVDIRENRAQLSIEIDYDEVEDNQSFLGLFSFGNVDRPPVHLVIQMPRTARLDLEDFSSDIQISGLQSDVSVETFSSEVRLSDLEGTVDIETYSGSIQGEDLRVQLQVETFSGDVTLRLAALSGDSRFETFSGDVELFLPADAGFEVVGSDETFGELSSEIALRSDQDGRRVAGEGGPRLEMDTFSGDLRLRKL